MPSIKTLALAASMATAAMAYSTYESTYDLEARDLDFSPEDLEVLFARDYEVEEDEIAILARDLDMEYDDVAYLAARNPSIISAAVKGVKSAAKFTSKHRNGLGQAASTGADMYQSKQQANAAKYQAQGGQRRRDLLDDDLVEEYLMARDPSMFSALTSGAKSLGGFASKHKESFKSAGGHAMNAAGMGANMYMANQQAQMYANQPQMYRRDAFEEEDPEMWY